MRIRQLIGPDAGTELDMAFADALACIKAGTAEAVADSGVVNAEIPARPNAGMYLDRQMMPARRHGRPRKDGHGLA